MNERPLIELGAEEIRSCTLEALKREPRTSESSLKAKVGAIAQERGLLGPLDSNLHSSPLPPGLWRRFRDVLWSLIIEGVLAIGNSEHNPTWPWLSLTEYGEQCVAAGEIVPHDPDGYLQALSVSRPLDDVEQRYVTQALEAFRRKLPDASAVMLGGASKHLLLVLGDGVAVTASAPEKARTTQKHMNGPALGLLLQLDSELQQRSLSRRLKEERATTFNGIAQVIRAARNEAGHPALGSVSRDECFINLGLFRHYRRPRHRSGCAGLQ